MTTPLLVYFDTAPTITATIDRGGAPVDLTGCTVYIQIRRVTDRRFLINAPCDIVSAALGQISYNLLVNDLDFVGACKLRFLVIYPDTRRQHTVPALDLTVEDA